MEREKKTKAIEMTTGSIWKNLFFLSCPLVFSQVLEVLFNMSDVAVVGRFSDYRALGGSWFDNASGHAVYRLSDRDGLRC